jgi:hypothetical protein
VSNGARVARELERCGIRRVDDNIGMLGPFSFRHQNYYWVAEGKVPIAVALELYEHPVGRTCIRVGGHCGCPSPNEYGAEFFDASGIRLWKLSEPAERQAKEESYMDRNMPGWRDEARFVESPARDAASGHVDTYHIDNELALYVFVETLRKHGLVTP